MAKPSVLELSWPRRWIKAWAAAAGTTLFAAPTLAAASTASSASPPSAVPVQDPVLVWYRSSAGCPDGDAFVGLLQRLGRPVSLAGAGDRIDFVVNLAFAEQESSGRLERQSSERTVAIRDVVATSCNEVAEVLALSLDLALSPESERAPAPSNEGAGWAFRIGAQGTFETGLARALLPGAAAFVDGTSLPRAWSLRLSLRGAWGERDAAAAIDVRLLASRAEGCWSWTFDDIALGPCGGVDLGLVFADSPVDGGRSDTGVWSSAVAHGRASWQIGRLGLELEAQVGLLLPFVRYRFGAQTGEELVRSAPIGLETALGISFRL